ncbi:CCA tRNA nucleotidyltransferase [Zavarzinia sp. CC-PAN008]|uniref:CCA tRNA nucleotidyltransferase n=1 Tax=Zavarzinia sp. CC-PAN008 TaxID=3243332 RepID=UPI003F744331
MTQPLLPVAAQAWFQAPATRRILDAVAPARFVGGCVRDALLGRTAKDIDLATPLTPEQVMARAKEAGIRTVPTGLAHGTVTLIADHVAIEVTTLRRDVETDGRHAVVAFTDDWAADAARRDFTMNALYADAEGRVHDLVGGIADLERGLVRFVGEPDQRIAEDRLRVLRYFRFHAWYGRGAPDAPALAACARAAGTLGRLSAERVGAELFKLLSAPDPLPALVLMDGAHVLPALLPQPLDLARLAALVAIEGRLKQVDADLRLAALVRLGPDAVAGFSQGLRLSRRRQERLAALAAPRLPLRPDMAPQAMRRLLFLAGAQTVRDHLMLSWAEAAQRGEASDPEAWQALLAQVDAWVPVALPVRGADVVALGVAPGPAVAQALAEVQDWWVEGDFAAGRAACLARLRARVGGA